MKKYIDNLKKQAEENPLAAAAIAVTAVGVLTKAVQANTERKNSNTWKKEVDRRMMTSR